MMISPLIGAFVDAAAISLLLVIAARVLSAAPRKLAAWLIAMVVFGSICNILSARQDYAYDLPAEFQLDFGQWYIVLNLARNSTSAVLLLLAHVIFREDRRFSPLLILVMLLQLFFEEPLGWMLGEVWISNDTLTKVLVNEMIPACLQFAMSSIALYWAAIGRHVDLVEKRRTTRAVLMVVLAGIVSLVVERVGFFSGQIPFFLMYPIHMSILVVQVLILFLIVLSFMRKDIVGYLEPAKSTLDVLLDRDDTQHIEVERIRHALESEKVYRQMGLSVHQLAEHLALPQYRLRNLIHNHMGFRNFNNLLHHYRIAEVCEALEDVRQNTTPVLTLALSSGYQSIAPFNRAFREQHGLTPTQYRQSKQQ